MDIYQQRFQRAQKLLATQQVDAVVVTSTPNFFYFTGTWLESNERLQAIVIPQQGTPTLLAHEMFKEQVAAAGVDMLFWSDGQVAVELLNQYLPSAGTVAIDNSWPSGNLIQLMQINTHLNFVDSKDILGALRLHKDQVEVARLKESGKTADRVMESLAKFIKPGLTERQVADEIRSQFKQLGVSKLSFDVIVSTGDNCAIPHHVPDGTVLQAGQTVLIDMGGIKDYYCSDITRTFALGQPSLEIRTVYEIVKTAQQQAFLAIKPGVTMEHVDAVARNIITEAGYGQYFTHRTGHGVGIEIHEEPYLAAGNFQRLAEGMVVSVEPGIYLPGKFGVRIEDTVVVTATGAERLNNFTRELIIKP
ncbi:Xaa-Pro peptidase family protein [Peptococcaceae bacterium 1198_IL3148]